MPSPFSRNISAVIALNTLLCTGCASVAQPVTNPDPWEPVNRPLDRVNEVLDDAFFEPVTDAYVKVTPQPLRDAISHFFDNLALPNAILNDLLQGKGREAGRDSGRFLVNSTLGLLGLLDVAQHMNLPQPEEDFGQTLGVWGAGPGPYLVLPVLGPNSVRDIWAIPVGMVTNPLFYSEAALTVPLYFLATIDARARVGSAMRIRDAAALDRYTFTRDAYSQHRESLIYDGNPPPPDFYDDENGTAPLP
jgi:phospholipid-binding lipoprotein MlaA